MCVEVFYYMLVVVLIFNIMVLGSIIGFIIIGFFFNIEFYFFYIVFSLWVIVYIFRGTYKYYV